MDIVVNKFRLKKKEKENEYKNLNVDHAKRQYRSRLIFVYACKNNNDKTRLEKSLFSRFLAFYES